MIGTRARSGVLLGVVAGIWAFAFVGYFGTYVTTFDEGLRLVAALLFGLPVVAGAVAAVAIRSHPLDIPILAVIATYALVSALSVDQTASLETLALATAYGSLFLVLLRVQPGPVRQGLVIGCAFAASAWLAFSAIRWVQDAMTWISLDGTVPPLVARSGNLWLSTDAVAALAVLAAPFYFHIQRGAPRNVLAAVAVGAAIIVIPLSGGRVEWAAILVAALVYLLTSGAHRWRRLRRPIIFAGGAAAALGIALFVSGWLGTLSGRGIVWQTALAVIAEHPLDGAGPGTFSWVRLTESPELLNRYPVYHAHNFVLQTLADGGLLLLAAVTALAVLYVRHLGRGTVPLTPAHRAAIASLAGFAVILMLDELTQLPALTALAIGSAAFTAADRSVRRAPGRARIPGSAPALGLALAVLLALPATLGAHQARVAATVGRERAIAGDWEDAERAFATAAAAWPTRASYELALGLADAHLGRDGDALAHYQRAHELSPGDPRALGGLGILGLSEAARADALRQASRLGSLDSQYGYRLALELLAAGDRGSATDELGRAALLDPQLLVALDIAGLGFDVEEVVGAVRRALDDEGGLAGVDAAVTEAAMEVALGQVPSGNGTLAAIALARAGELHGARMLLAELLRAEPQARAARLAARETSRVACDAAEEARHDRILALLPGGYAALYLPAPGARETRDHVYREMGLGDYQPPQGEPVPVYAYEWPAGYLGPDQCPARR